MDTTIAVFFSLFTLLLISTGVFSISRRTGIPYTVALVIAGLALIPISHIPFFSFITSFTLTPELLFFVFLPVLIFESAYNIKMKSLFENIRSIGALAVIGLLISASVIALLMKMTLGFFGLPVPFIVLFLFGALISATDPVAVLSLFKEYGAPRRLSLIFEGESLFNDATSLALFMIILEIMTTGWHGTASIADALFMFSTMMAGGVILGLCMGTLFSKIIGRVKNSDNVEIVLTMIVAHLTFLISELISSTVSFAGHPLHLSSITATVVASMVIGNYGRSKISPKVEEYMERFWGYFAFVANSLVFMLMGLMFTELPIDFRLFLIPIPLTILIVMFARAVSIYPVISFLNMTKKEDHIPFSWQHLLAWGSLRGALAITMVLLIPDDLTVPGWTFEFSVKDFITAITVSSIYFTLFVKATTIGPLIKKLKLDQLHEIEKAQYEESRVLIYAQVLLKIEVFKEKGYIDDETYVKVRTKYQALYARSCASCDTTIGHSEDLLRRLLSVYAIGAKKSSLRNLFVYKEVTENIYKKIDQDLHAQLASIEKGTQSMEVDSRGLMKRNAFERTTDVVFGIHHNETLEYYMYYRARAVIARKAIKELAALAKGGLDMFKNNSIIDEAIANHTKIKERAEQQAFRLKTANTTLIAKLNEEFAEHGLFKAEEKFIEDLFEKEMITPKINIMLTEELEKGAV